MQFIDALWSEFASWTPLTQAGFVLGLLGFNIGSIVVAVTRIGRANRIIDGLQAQTEQLRGKLEDARRQLTELAQHSEDERPEARLKSAERELSQGNVTQYSRHLEEFGERFRALEPLAHRLALHETSLIFGSDPDAAFNRAMVAAMRLVGSDSGTWGGSLVDELLYFRQSGAFHDLPSLTDDWAVRDGDARIFLLHSVEIIDLLRQMNLVHMAAAFYRRSLYVSLRSAAVTTDETAKLVAAYADLMAGLGDRDEVDALAAALPAQSGVRERLSLRLSQARLEIFHGRFDAAREALESLMADTTAAEPRTDAEFAQRVRSELALARCMTGNDDREVLLEDLAQCRQADGPLGNDTLHVIGKLAFASAGLGDLAGAERYLEQSIDAYSRRNGADHYMTINMRNALAHLQREGTLPPGF